ncbi:MAG: hydrogenase nickel incorporation protein HypB [Candidatus Cyclonatronum sp.]|uniref:hydrogenase nickel incorporation protein HypB n=1 Tax=Cyclonatronum sp. TaxID=3024185 RepID=UPI0025BD3844|nr:hydrogenase nickel incorporation protein HypB [Cyclonatronum sp.]MCH8485321.1 hydrogenase nickel incorporation protein HypB [Cyclonatronum sp.]
MCITCGCGAPESRTNLHHHSHTHGHDHDHAPDHGHAHAHGHSHGITGVAGSGHSGQHDDHLDHHDNQHHHTHETVQDTGGRLLQLERDVLYENKLLAERNRGYCDAKGILALNLVSSPGSGKTQLLERTLTDLKGELNFAVIEGDQHTSNDADRIRATGTPAVQINTGKGCHLDAHMVLHALQELKPAENSVLFIENVGNLVCPAMFDLGEEVRVVIMSVTEGDDKPVKYPDMFHSSAVCVINKTDLLPYVPFDLEKAKANARKVNPKLIFFELSCTSGEGLDSWYSWLCSKMQQKKDN